MVEAEIIEVGQAAWRTSVTHVCFFMIGAWAGASLIMQGTKLKQWALKTILTPIILLISGSAGAIAAWNGGAEFWLFIAILLLSSIGLTMHAMRLRQDRADRLATIAAGQQRAQAAHKRRQK